MAPVSAGDLRQNWTPGPGQDTANSFRGTGAPVDGAAGTGVGFADKGWEYVDEATGFKYVNYGTRALPEWHGVLTT